MLVVDCSQLCYSSFYTMSDLSYNEKKTGVIFGFLQQIFTIAKKFNSCDFVFCWDSKKRYRKLICKDYKANRDIKKLTPIELKERRQMFLQMADLRQKIIPKLGFKNSFIKTGLEADDLISYIAMHNKDVVVVSSDNDLLQLLDFCIIFNTKTKKKFTKSDFCKKWNIKPSEWYKVKAIAGCGGDNVKGVKGVGEKTAIKYINGVLPDGKVKDRIDSENSKEMIKMNEALVKLPFDVDAYRDIIIDDNDFVFDNWCDVFEEYGLKSFFEKDNFNKLKELFLLNG